MILLAYAVRLASHDQVRPGETAMSVVETPRSQGLIARVINIVMHPRTEWDVIASEHATTQGLILGYAAVLAAIPALAQLIRGLMPHCFFVACYTPNPIFVVVGAVVYYLLALASVFVIGLIIEALAPSFGGEKSQVQAMKVAAYSWTAAWLAGIFIIIPWVGWLFTFLLSLYSLYLLYLGLRGVLKSPEDKAVVFTLVVVVIAFLVFLVAGHDRRDERRVDDGRGARPALGDAPSRQRQHRPRQAAVGDAASRAAAAA